VRLHQRAGSSEIAIQQFATTNIQYLHGTQYVDLYVR
jgi:hypothetical protein